MVMTAPSSWLNLRTKISEITSIQLLLQLRPALPLQQRQQLCKCGVPGRDAWLLVPRPGTCAISPQMWGLCAQLPGSLERSICSRVQTLDVYSRRRMNHDSMKRGFHGIPGFFVWIWEASRFLQTNFLWAARLLPELAMCSCGKSSRSGKRCAHV